MFFFGLGLCVLLILAELVVRTFDACLVCVFCAARFLCSPLGAASLLVGMSLARIAVTHYEFIWRYFAFGLVLSVIAQFLSVGQPAIPSLR